MDYVLDGMVQEGWLSQADRDKAKFPKIAKRKTDNRLGGTNGYLLNAVRKEVVTKGGLTDADVDGGGLKIVRPSTARPRPPRWPPSSRRCPRTAPRACGVGLVAVKPGDGAVVAMYGGKNSIKNQLQLRHPGARCRPARRSSRSPWPPRWRTASR